MLDGLKGYVSLVSGLTEATAAKAREVATALLAQGGVQGVPAGASAMATQIAGLAEDLLVTARDNRGVLMEVVRAEAERAVASIGVITTAEAETLRGRIADLERELAAERARAGATVARKAAPRTSSARRATAPVTTPPRATRSGAKKPTAPKTVAKKDPAKAPAAAAPGKKAPGKKAPGKKVTPTTVARAGTRARTTAATKRTTTTRSAPSAPSPTTPGAGTGE